LCLCDVNVRSTFKFQVREEEEWERVEEIILDLAKVVIDKSLELLEILIGGILSEVDVESEKADKRMGRGKIELVDKLEKFDEEVAVQIVSTLWHTNEGGVGFDCCSVGDCVSLLLLSIVSDMLSHECVEDEMSDMDSHMDEDEEEHEVTEEDGDNCKRWEGELVVDSWS